MLESQGTKSESKMAGTKDSQNGNTQREKLGRDACLARKKNKEKSKKRGKLPGTFGDEKKQNRPKRSIGSFVCFSFRGYFQHTIFMNQMVLLGGKHSLLVVNTIRNDQTNNDTVFFRCLGSGQESSESERGPRMNRVIGVSQGWKRLGVFRGNSALLFEGFCAFSILFHMVFGVLFQLVCVILRSLVDI